MIPYRQIRANYDRDSVVVYQAYAKSIARAALDAGQFVPPFSWRRMTWIKPSFLWMMQRSHWASKPGQQYILAVRIRRPCWDRALRMGVLTCFDSQAHRSTDVWRAAFERASVHIQWDPERTIHGKKLEHRTIQVGLCREIIRRYTDDWVLDISDRTALVRKIRSLYLAGNLRRAKELLPKERAYPVDRIAADSLGVT